MGAVVFERRDEMSGEPVLAASATAPALVAADSERRDMPPTSVGRPGDDVVGEKRLSGGGDEGSRARSNHGADDVTAVSYTHLPSPRDATLSRMPSSA